MPSGLSVQLMLPIMPGFRGSRNEGLILEFECKAILSANRSLHSTGSDRVPEYDQTLRNFRCFLVPRITAFTQPHFPFPIFPLP